MPDQLETLTIVSTGDNFGVVLGRLENEYWVRIVACEQTKYDGTEYFALGTGLFSRDQISRYSFCENDYMPGLILAAAGNYSHRYGNRRVRVV